MRVAVSIAMLFVVGCIAPLRAQVGELISVNDSSLSSGSVVTVTEDRMNKGLVNNALEALNGQAAGVNVSSSGADRMAMLNSVRVRGTTSVTGGNDPLVIIDGVYSDLTALSTVYPADIESFSILKNASETAQYGSRGASGVIVVRTKRGGGGKFHITYDGNFGFESVYKTVSMLNAAEYRTTADALGIYYNDGGYDTDFQRSLTRTGYVMNHHVSFSGGNEQSSYRASLGMIDDNSVIKIQSYDNFVAKVDLSQMAFDDFLKVDMGVFGSSQKNKGIFDEWKLFYSAASQNPTFSYGQNSSGGWDKNTTASQINPPGALMKEKNDTKNMYFNTHLSMNFDFSKLGESAFFADGRNSLNLRLFGSYSYSSQENSTFCPTWVWAQGQATRAEFKTEDWLGDAALDYGFKSGGHQFNATLMGEYQVSRKTGFWTMAKGFTTNEFGYDNLGAGSIRPYGGTGSSYEKPALASAMLSLSYTLLDRYNLALTTRADGSSMFSEGNKWGFFPSVSFSWDVLKDLDAIGARSLFSMLKFRTGYGSSGNLGAVSSYNSLNLVSQNGVVSVDGKPVTTMGITHNINDELSWETRSTFNVGADMGFWSNRLVLTA
jgi:TonB-dependent SusC/RagA subfamily outer membrane receptor